VGVFSAAKYVAICYAARGNKYRGFQGRNGGFGHLLLKMILTWLTRKKVVKKNPQRWQNVSIASIENPLSEGLCSMASICCLKLWMV
jgi:hypothetical protein